MIRESVMRTLIWEMSNLLTRLGGREVRREAAAAKQVVVWTRSMRRIPENLLADGAHEAVKVLTGEEQLERMAATTC